MRPWGAVSLLLLVAPAGCDTGSAATTANTNAADSASRLRTRTWLVTDADPAESVELFRFFFDAQRKERCAFVQDGVAHVGPGPTYWCLPIDSAQHDATGGLALFADAACHVPLALAPATGSAKFVISRPANACAAAPAVYLAEPVQTVQPYAFDGFKCGQVSGTVATQALGEEVPLSEFASATEVVTVAAGKIASLELKAVDGTRQPIGGYDRTRGVAVDARDQGGASDPRWFPSRLAFEGAGTALFSDVACKSAVPTKIARDAICPLGGSFAFEGACGDGKFYSLVAAVDIATLHEKSALGACVAAKEDGVVAYTRGTEIARGAFVAASLGTKGNGRIRLRGWSDGTTTPVWSEFFDAQLNTPCTIAALADGTFACLPSASASVTLFADNACKIPAYEEPLDGCGVKEPPTWVTDSTGQPYRVTGPATTLYEAKSCKPHVPVTPSRGFALEAADLATFARATEKSN